MGRTVIVGDVHGCASELDALLDGLAFATGDKLVFVGDLVARGPDSVGVLAIARRTGAVMVRGNHEEKLLGWKAAVEQAARTGRGSRRKLDDDLGSIHLDVALAMRDVDWSLLRTAPLWYDLPEHAVRVVHAGVMPGVPVESLGPGILTRMRTLTAQGQAAEEKGTRLWGCFYTGPPHVVFGHNAMAEPQFHPWATGLDTSCVYGGRLTALVLAPGQPVPRGEAVKPLLVTVAARKIYYDWARKKPTSPRVG